jgi:DNA recombination protein RmuC
VASADELIVMFDGRAERDDRALRDERATHTPDATTA